MSLDATIKGASANAYLDAAEADTYFADRLYSTDWAGADAADKDKALIMATRLVDQQFDYQGWKTTSTQVLQWPREGVMTRGAGTGDLLASYLNPSDDFVDEDTIPDFVKNATCEVAISLLSEDREAEPDTLGIKKMKIDVLEFEFDKTDRKKFIPNRAWEMLKFYAVRASGCSIEILRT